MKPTLPKRIDHYEVVRRIGGGGMAETFEVVWSGSSGVRGRGCLKLLLGHRAEDPRSRACFAREARIAGSLRHSNLVGMIDYNLEAERPYVVFEYVEGLDLRTLQEAAPLSPPEVVYVGSKIASALHYAHGYRDEEVRGVLHRDLSPQNVLVSTEGDIRLADFGLAGIRTDTSVTVADHIAGTLPYVAPEVVRVEKVSEQSDLYGLGVILYELASGRAPYEGGNQYALLRKIAAGERSGPPLQSLAPGYSAAFYELVSQLLATDPAMRPQSAEDVVRGLARCGASRRQARSLGRRVKEAIEASQSSVDPEATTIEAPEQLAESVKPPRRRPRRSVALLASLGLVGVAIAVWAGGSWARSIERAVETSTRGGGTVEPTEVSVVEVPAVSTMKEPDVEVPDRPDEAEPSEPAVGPATRQGKGTLVVRAVPWGNVWIDGRAFGRAPARLKVKPGVHKIQVGDEYAGPPRYVRVSPGKVKTVTLDLEVVR